MQSILKERLQAYLIENNPELIGDLQEELSVNGYLEHKVRGVMPYVLDLLSEDKPSYVIVELALEKMTRDLRPSRFKYIKEVLCTEFSEEYERFKKSGVLTFECVSLIKHCKAVFEAFEFSEGNEANTLLRHAVIAKIHDYLT